MPERGGETVGRAGAYPHRMPHDPTEVGHRWLAYWRSPVIRALIGALVVVAAFAWALPSFASYREVGHEVWGALHPVEGWLAVALVVVTTANLVAPATAQRAALPGLTMPVALAVDWVTSAVTNLVPGGSAAAVGMTWSMYRSRGLASGAIARSVVVTGVWDLFVKLSTPLLAVVWLSTQQPAGPGLVQAAVVGAVLFGAMVVLAALVLGRPQVVEVAARVAGRLPVIGPGLGPRLAEMRRDTLALVRQRGLGLTFWTVAGHANLYLLLVLCLRAVGIGSETLSWAGVLAAFAFGRLVTAVPVTPGGLGVMEVTLTAALGQVGTAAGAVGPDPAAVVAAVLVFRFASLVLPLPLGALAWLAWTTAPLPPKQARAR